MEKQNEINQRIALSLLHKHDHAGKGTLLEQSNCGACALNGYGDRKTCPNYSGWARIYVQAGKIIPAKYWNAFQKEVASDNKLYRGALLEDIKTFGLNIEKE